MRTIAQAFLEGWRGWYVRPGVKTIFMVLVAVEVGLWLGGWRPAGADEPHVILSGLLLTAGGVYWLLAWFLRQVEGTLPLPAVSLVMVALLLDAAGNLLGWYATIPWFDLLVHGASGLAVATFFYAFGMVQRQREQWVLPRRWVRLLALAMAVLAGVLFEIGEYGVDMVFGSEIWLGTGADTVSDLMADMAGAMLGIVVYAKLSSFAPSVVGAAVNHSDR